MRQEDDLRYSRLSDIIQVVIRMQGTSEGLTLKEIAEEICATTRTAARVKSVILRNFPQIDELPSKTKHKRWGFINTKAQREFLSGLIGFSCDEIMELEKIKKRFDADSNLFPVLNNIINKIRALMQDARGTSKKDNIKALLEFEGYAINQFSTTSINEQVLKIVRNALISNKYLRFNYTTRTGKSSQRQVAPYGILYNYKNYLVAKDGKIKLFDFDNISDVLLLNENFTPDKNFNLEEYVSRSFGIYQEKPLKIKLLFDKKSATDVKRYYFHPTQKITEIADGSVEVEFESGGTTAICWELFKWGEHVKILEPIKLKTIYKTELTKILNKQ